MPLASGAGNTETLCLKQGQGEKPATRKLLQGRREGASSLTKCQGQGLETPSCGQSRHLLGGFLAWNLAPKSSKGLALFGVKGVLGPRIIREFSPNAHATPHLSYQRGRCPAPREPPPADRARSG